MIFVNFKTYEGGTGSSAVELAQILENVADEAHIKVIPVVQAADIKEVVSVVKLEVWAQKVDPINYGAHTGGILPEAVMEDGAMGSFLNHSENRFPDYDTLKDAVKRCSEVGLKSLIFAKDMVELKKVIEFRPTFVSYEPPDLVGSKKTSVAKEKPEIILEAVEIAKKDGIPLIVGAGIKSSTDVAKSLELGAVGVAVASDIVASDDPKKELLELVSGFEREI